jgi:hypothetical protein
VLSWLMRQRWPLLLVVTFALYALLLLANAYRSQAQLRAAAEARLLADTSPGAPPIALPPAGRQASNWSSTPRTTASSPAPPSTIAARPAARW